MTTSARIEEQLAIENWTNARRLIRRSLAASPGDHWLWSRLALTYYEQRKYKEALKHETRALALQPHCPLALWGLAGTYKMLGEFDEAASLYQRLIKRGATRIATGRCGEGIRWARGLVADCWYRLGEIREARGQRRRAAAAYRKHLAARSGGASIYDASVVRARLKVLERNPSTIESSSGKKMR